MPRFFNRSLSLLDRVLNFAGGDVPPNEMSPQPIQRVYDVAPEARLNSRGGYALTNLGGYLYLGQTLTHAVADTQYAETDVYAAFELVSNIYDFRTAEHRLWLVSIFVQTNNTALSSVASGITFTDPATRSMVLYFGNEVTALEAGLQNVVESDVRPPWVPSHPIFLPPGTTWNTRSISTGALVTSPHAIFWAGPIGATPPGMS